MCLSAIVSLLRSVSLPLLPFQVPKYTYDNTGSAGFIPSLLPGTPAMPRRDPPPGHAQRAG